MTQATTDTALFSVRVHADACTAHVLIFPDGLRIGLRPGKGRLVSWTEISRLADGPPADRFGVVVNGRLILVLEEEAEAQDRAADQRQIGLDATVIRVPVSLPS